jgi:membrane associated rhomboid family serine protease
MTTPSAAAKTCVVCRQDCSNKPRIKDAKGLYYCRSCLEAAQARRSHAPRAPQPPGVRSTPPDAPDAGAYGLEAAIQPPPILRGPHAAPPSGSLRCPSCGQALAPGQVICVACGINAVSGRPLVTADQGNVERRKSNARDLIWFASWIPSYSLLFFPISSEAHGSSRPYAIRAIAVITIVISLFVLLFEGTGASPMRGLKNLYLWAGDKEPTADYLEQLYTYTEWGDRAAFERKKTELSASTPPADLALAAHNALTGSRRAVGEFHWWQLFTHAFLHGDIFHLAGNLVFLFIFGARINALIGNLGTLIVYPVLILASALPQMLAVHDEMPIPSLGASGVIMGLAGMYFIFFPAIRVQMAIWINPIMFIATIAFVIWISRQEMRLAEGIAPLLVLTWIFRCRSFWVLLLFIGFDVYYTLRGIETGTAHWAHMGGFLAGMAVGLVLLLSRAVNPRGSDILSMMFGPYAWPILGKPSQWGAGGAGEGWLERLRIIPQSAFDQLTEALRPRMSEPDDPVPAPPPIPGRDPALRR